MLRVVSRKGDWACIACNDCGQEYDEQWSFVADNIREWARSIRETHVCPIELLLDEEEFDPDMDLDSINAELERFDRYINETTEKTVKRMKTWKRGYNHI